MKQKEHPGYYRDNLVSGKLKDGTTHSTWDTEEICFQVLFNLD
jgi:ribosomal protein L31